MQETALTQDDIERVIDALDDYRTRDIEHRDLTAEEAVWKCKIGGSFPHGALPYGSDGPMRAAVEEAYERLTGSPSGYVFSGWGAELDEGERAVVEHRAPVYERTDWALLKNAADTIEALWAEVQRLRG